MSESPIEEPVRWLEDPSAGAALRGDLGHAAKAGAVGVDYGATLVALRGAIASQTGALAPAAVAGRSFGLKAAIGGVVIGGIAGLWALRAEPDVDAKAGREAKPAATVIAEAEPRIDDAPTPARDTSRVATPAIVAPTPAPAPTVAPTIAPESEAEPEDDKPIRKRTAEPDSNDAADEADDYMREARLVALARKQLGSDPEKALASTRKHGREFPKGALVEESRALEVRALAQLGRMDDARTAAEAFLGDFGDGPHAAAVRRAVAGDDDVQ